MNALALILSFLLSLFSWGGGDSVVGACPDAASGTVYAQQPSEPIACQSLNRDICLSASSGYTFAGAGSSTSFSVRTVNAGRRVHHQEKSSFRMLKSGKVIDNNNIHPFLTISFVLLSGTRTPERFLYSICRLRL